MTKLFLFGQHELKLMLMLTEGGTEYCGNRENHQYELLQYPKNTIRKVLLWQDSDADFYRRHFDGKEGSTAKSGK